MIEEKFTCINEDFAEADSELGFVGATYQSPNFELTLSYTGAYNKDKTNKKFIKHDIGFMLKPRNAQTLNKYPSIAYTNETNPYAEESLMSMDDSPSVNSTITSNNYMTYNEIFTFARKIFDEILPKYFPKDAQYVSYADY